MKRILATGIITVISIFSVNMATADTNQEFNWGDRIENHLDQKSDQIINQLNRKRNRIDRKLERKGNRANKKFDRRQNRQSNRDK